MMPPRCTVCSAEPGHGGVEPFEVVYFADRVEFPEGWVGHQPNAFWFCGLHLALGREREHLVSQVAMREINALLYAAGGPGSSASGPGSAGPVGSAPPS